MSRLSGHRKQIGLAGMTVFLIMIMAADVIYNNRSGSSASLFDANNGKFTLQPGDILARPNLNWLPGSSNVASGRKFGHVAIVVKGAAGNRPEEALQKAMVVEACIYDQGTRRFIFKKEKQVRLAPALVSFGTRFSGIRYRLRMPIDLQQQEELVFFLNGQTGKCPYKIFSNNRKCKEEGIRMDTLQPAYDGWNCASLVFYALCRATGINIDFNQGAFVYPNDIINSPVFNSSEGRLRF
jgi:hypothetical protein